MKTKHFPLALAVAVIVAVQIACTYALLHREPPIKELFVDHVQQLVYDGQVVRADLGRAWISDANSMTPGATETRIVGRLVLTKDATLRLHRQLGELLAVVRAPEAQPAQL